MVEARCIGRQKISRTAQSRCVTKEKRLFTYDNRNSRDGDDIALISILLQYAAGDGAEGENAGI